GMEVRGIPAEYAGPAGLEARSNAEDRRYRHRVRVEGEERSQSGAFAGDHFCGWEEESFRASRGDRRHELRHLAALILCASLAAAQKPPVPKTADGRPD